MGHIRLGVLPKNPTWKSLVNQLDSPIIDANKLSEEAIFGATEILQSDGTQACVSYCVWLLAQLVIASKNESFPENLSKNNIQIRPDASVIEFISDVSQLSNENLSKFTPHTVINNIANISIRETLLQTIALQSNSLFGTNTEDLKLALRKYSTQKQFSNLLHSYFSVFLQRVIRLVIDKEIGLHISPEKGFKNIQAVSQFDSSISIFSNQTARIVDTFSSGWYSKRIWQDGTISQDEARKFVFIALKKLRSDLKISGGQL